MQKQKKRPLNGRCRGAGHACAGTSSCGPMADSSLKTRSSDHGAHSCIGLRASAAASVISEGKHVYKQKNRPLNGGGHGAGRAHAATLSCRHMVDPPPQSRSSDHGAYSCIGLRASATASVLSEGLHV